MLAALAVASAAAAAGPAILGSDQIKRAGIVIETLRPARFGRSVGVLGVVLDPAPLIRLHGDIAVAEAAVAEVKAKLALAQQLSARAAQLYAQRIMPASDYEKAKGDVSAATIALGGARVRRAALLAEAGAHWGLAMAAALRSGGDPLPQLAAGEAILIGLSLPPGAGLADPPQHVEAEASGIRFALRLIGPVPGMLGGYPGQSFLYQAAAQAEVPVGATVSAALAAGPARTGVAVPRSAVVWRDGGAVVFRAGAGSRFEPVPIATDTPTAGGYFVSAVLTAGDRIVVRGAALLLGAGEKPRLGGGEDEDED